MSNHDNVMEHRTLDERVAAEGLVVLLKKYGEMTVHESLSRLARAESIISKQRGALHFFHEDGIYDVNATEQHNNVRADVLRNALALRLDEEQKP